MKPRHHKAVQVRKNSKSTTECVARNAPSVHNDKAVAVVCPDGDNVPTPRIYVTLVGGRVVESERGDGVRNTIEVKTLFGH